MPTPCYNIRGLQTEEATVMGMLSEPLRIALDSPDGATEVDLENVLVIDPLPVPLHVSVKYLAGTLGPVPARDILSKLATGPPQLGKGLFPRRYWVHPFWIKAGLGPGGLSAAIRARELQLKANQDSQRPLKKPAKKAGHAPLRACAFCEAKETKGSQLLRCGVCKASFYCNVDCQKAHWKVHKRSCTRQ